MILVTGGAGFIVSNLVAALNRLGHTNVVVNDFLGCDGKWHNLRKRTLADLVSPPDLSRWLEGRKLTAVFHMVRFLTPPRVMVTQSSSITSACHYDCLIGARNHKLHSSMHPPLQPMAMASTALSTTTNLPRSSG
jgi:UDP-glucose 4-epimerase